MSKKNLLFFSRDYQSNLFPLLVSEEYNSLHVTLTIKEKNTVEKLGGQVIACLETDYPFLTEYEIKMPYLIFSWGSDRFLRNYKYDERLSIQKKLVTFWSNILDLYEPIAVINEPVVIEVSEILYIEAKKRQIRYLSLGYFNNPNNFFWFPDGTTNSFKSIINDIVVDNIEIDKAKKYIDKILNNLKPDYVINLQSRLSLKRLYVLIKDLLVGLYIRFGKPNKILRQICYGDNLSLYLLNIKLYILSIFKKYKYNSIDEAYKCSSEIIFYPLHYEPEGVLYYMAYFFDDQLELIKNILKCTGENRILLVKEHPQQPGMLLQKKYLELRKRYSNLFLIPAEVDSHKIINKSKLLLTLGGTIGFEALVNNKKVINFGSVFYDSFKGVTNCTSFKDLYEILRNGEDKESSNSDLIEFTAKIISLSYEGDPHPNKNLTDLKNINNIIKSIHNELQLNNKNYGKKI